MGGDSGENDGEESARIDEREAEPTAERGTVTPRRTVLRALGGAAALSAAAPLADRGRAEVDGRARADGREKAQADRTTVVLGARRDYWLGLQPRAIEGQRNPPLRLVDGQRYRLVWVNLDGARHRFRLLDADGNAVNRTQVADQRGATRAVRFRGREELAAYDCEFHPEAMRGPVELGEGFPTTTTEETTTAAEQSETTTAGEETTTAEPAETTTAGDGVAAEVAVGPQGNYFRFVPERVEIPVGGTVKWVFESAGHNVSARPEAARQVSLPEGTEPFSSYPEGESFRVVAEGETYEHTFEVPGEYTYVCVPHVGEGMIGTVVVTE
jgi:plastocyanin